MLPMVNIFIKQAEAWAPELRHRQHMAHLFKESARTVIQCVRSAHTSKDPPTTSAAPRVAGWRVVVLHARRSEQQWPV